MKKKRVEITSHQFFSKGEFIDWSKVDGILYAVILYDDGRVGTIKLPSNYEITFVKD
jgi:hypothetical protein